MIVADYSGDFPVAFLILPNHQELEGSYFQFSIFRMLKLVTSNLNGTITLNWMDFQAFFDQCSFESIVPIKYGLEVVKYLFKMNQPPIILVPF